MGRIKMIAPLVPKGDGRTVKSHETEHAVRAD
jgi:hypothetical protein